MSDVQLFRLNDEVEIIRDDKLFRLGVVEKIGVASGGTFVWVKDLALCFNGDGAITESLKSSHGNWKIRMRQSMTRPNETVEIPNVTYPDSGTRGEPKLRIVTHDYDTDVFDGNELIARFAGEHHLSNAKRFVDSSPASLAAKDEEIARLKIALADAIRRPMGVIPDSATGLVAADELDEAEKRRTAETSSLAAMREAIEVAREVFTQFEEGCGKPISFNLLSTLGQKLADIDSTTPPGPNDDGLAKLLREIEWRGDVYEMDGQRFEVCPLCEQDKDDGHSPECSLARWIAKVEGR